MTFHVTTRNQSIHVYRTGDTYTSKGVEKILRFVDITSLYLGNSQFVETKHFRSDLLHAVRYHRRFRSCGRIIPIHKNIEHEKRR